MKRTVLLAALALLAAAPASAATVTGTYTASLSMQSGGFATLESNLASPFSLTSGAARSLFLTVDPSGICLYNCNPTHGTITVTFSNLTVNGHNFGGFTETGLFTANYANQTDSVVWAGAVAQSGFGLDQDGNVPLVFTDTMNGGTFGTLKINLVDGADWNVQTWVEAGFTAAATTPLPAAVWLFGSALGGGAMLLRRRKKVRQLNA
jgi:hypothetical protein